jgi:endonuclease YncB( thermonuclease family)
VPAARVRSALARLRRLGGIDGELTYHNKTGFHTLAFERGTIQSVSGSDVVVKAADGTTWAWTIVSDTVVRKSGSKTPTSALAAGETVFAGGPVVNGARDARLIVIRAPTSGASNSTPTPTSSGSDSAKTSLS